MTLKELLSSVSPEEYTDYPLYQELLKVKPEYGSSRHIEVKMVNGEVAVYNVHIGSLECHTIVSLSGRSVFLSTDKGTDFPRIVNAFY